MRKAVQVDFEGYCSTDFIILRPKAGVDPRYASHAVDSETVFRHAERNSIGTGMPRTSWLAVSQALVWVPPLEEQFRIAEVLDTIDEAIQASERLVTKLVCSEEALLMGGIDFGVNEAQLGDVCSLLQDGTHLPPPRTSDGPLLLSVQNLEDGVLRRSPRDTHVPKVFWQDTRRTLPIEPGDICLAVVGATLGKVGVVPSNLPPFTVQRSLTVLRGNPMRMRNDYLLAVMRHGEFQRRVWQRANQTAQPGVYLNELRTLAVPSPSLDEQQRVCASLSEIARRLTAERLTLEKLRQTRMGLAADLLSGRVRTVAS
ncbi:MAG: restriction endonuclease subunit S [Acidimicrobiia bacterium]|nr:restriction endonuclease subunit S [Acidimicrobiia bacterium]